MFREIIMIHASNAQKMPIASLVSTRPVVKSGTKFVWLLAGPWLTVPGSWVQMQKMPIASLISTRSVVKRWHKVCVAVSRPMANGARKLGPRPGSTIPVTRIDTCFLHLVHVNSGYRGRVQPINKEINDKKTKQKYSGLDESIERY